MTHVVFAELTRGTGGSTLSLLHLLRLLDRTRFRATVVSVPTNRRIEDFRSMGVPVVGIDGRELAISTPDAAPSPAPGGFRATKIYRAASATRRFRARVLEPGRALAPVLRKLEADLVYVNFGLVGGAAVVEAARLAGIPCLCHERGLAPIYKPYRKLGSSVVRFISISNAVDNHLAGEGVTATARCVIHNGIDLTRFDPAAVKPAHAGSLPPGDGPLLVSAGRLAPWKGVDVLLRAVALLRAEFPAVRVVVAGEGEQRAELEALAATLDLTDQVCFTGFVPDVRPWIVSGSVLVHAAVEPEPFGRTVLEGFALGVPVVATALGGVLEIVEPEVDGLLVPPADPRELAAALGRLLRDPLLRERLAGAGLKKVAERFDHARTAAEIQAVLADLANRS